MSTLEVIRYKDEFGVRLTDDVTNEQVIAMLAPQQWANLGTAVSNILEEVKK